MDPTLRVRTIEALKARISDLSPQMRTAAKYVVDHPSDFGLDPIRETARKASVSTYTLVNMSKKMGFDSFDSFRSPFRHALISTANDSAALLNLRGVPGREGSPGIFKNAAQNSLSIAARSLERQDEAELERLTDMLFGARHVYLTAVRSSYAMAYYFHYVGRMALPNMELIPRHHNSAIDDLNDAGSQDVLIAITVTPYSRETIEACQFARKRGVRLVLISDSEVVSPEFDPEFTLATSVTSSHHFGSFVGMLSVLEGLVAMLFARGGDAARKRIRSYEKIRLENNAYWVAQEKH